MTPNDATFSKQLEIIGDTVPLLFMARDAERKSVTFYKVSRKEIGEGFGQEYEFTGRFTPGRCFIPILRKK